MTNATLPPMWLDYILDGMEGPTLHLLPTTPQLVSIVRDRAAARPITVIGPSLPGGLDATRFLALLKAGSIIGRGICISFSDQLVSAADAPLPVEHGGVRSYFPAIELIANRGYSFTLRVWAGDGFRLIHPSATKGEILRALDQYFRSCESLGSEWLARAAQTERSHAERIKKARLRLRAFHSALMNASPGRLSPTYHRIASELMATERSL